MSSAVGANNTVARQQYILDLQDNGAKPKFTAQDADGDGVPDGEALTSDDSKKGTDAAALAIAANARKAESSASLSGVVADATSGGTEALKTRGLSVTSSGLQSVDGFTTSSANINAALSFTGAPTLPESDSASRLTGSGTTRSAPLFGNNDEAKFSDFMNRTGGEDAALMWFALSEMAKTSAKDVKDAAELKNAMQMGKIEAKKAEIKSTEEQIDAERAAAGFSFAFSIAQAAITIAFASGGDSVKGTIAQSVGGLVKSLGDYINKTAGPQAEADDKKVEIMRHQMMQEMMEQGVETAKANYDDAKENMKLALKILTEHAERQTQISSTITRT